MGDIGKNIRALRMRKKLSQDQLAQILHVTRQTISNYETGRSRPDVEMLAELARALDADMKELLCAPAHREAHLRRLRRLTVSAAATALAGALDAVGFLWGRHLMEVFFIGRVYYAAVYLLHPLFTLLLGRTLALGLLALLRTDPPGAPVDGVGPVVPPGSHGAVSGAHRPFLPLSGRRCLPLPALPGLLRHLRDAYPVPPFRHLPPPGPGLGQRPVGRGPGAFGAAGPAGRQSLGKPGWGKK